MYTPEQIEAFGARLRSELVQLEQDLQAARDMAQAEHASAHGEPLDNSAEASAEAVEEVRLQVDAQQSVELRELRAALLRIDEGTFGLCVDCGRDVEQQRLQAYPSAARCLACQEKREGGRR